MKNLLILILFIAGCGGSYDVNVRDSLHTIHVDNPIIEYCERLYPEILYPETIEREENITKCMKICQKSDNCSVTLPENVNN